MRSSAAVAAAAAGRTTVPARAATQHGCVGRHLANRNEMRVSGFDSYALLLFWAKHLSPASKTISSFCSRTERPSMTSHFAFSMSVGAQSQLWGVKTFLPENICIKM